MIRGQFKFERLEVIDFSRYRYLPFSSPPLIWSDGTASARFFPRFELKMDEVLAECQWTPNVLSLFF
jgi:hypothetical protein